MSHLLKVCHLAPPMGPSYGGPFQSVRHLAIALARHADVSVSMPWSDEAARHLNDWCPVAVRCQDAINVPGLGWSGGFRRDLLSRDVEVLHTHGLWQYPSWAAIAWKRRWQRPHVASIRGMLEPWAWQHHAWKKRPVWQLWERRNLQSASLLHATSAEEVTAIRARGLVAPVAVIPNGVWLPEDEGESSGAESLVAAGSLGSHRNELRFTGEAGGERTRTALYLGRLHPIKGLPMLLEAWQRVSPRGWRLRIVGPDEGSHQQELQRTVAQRGLSDQVEFLPAVHGDVAKSQLYREADLFVLPTHSENFGIAVAEALAHGVPVITTQGAPWRLLDEQRCGWWVAVDPAAIGTALCDATSRPAAELREMGLRGRVAVAQRFSWDKISLDFMACYLWLLNQGPKPDFVID